MNIAPYIQRQSSFSTLRKEGRQQSLERNEPNHVDD